jgi:dihydroxyacetone kinase-like protein
MAFKAHTARTWLALAATRLQEAKEHLTALDAAIGDADHGVNIARGFAAASARDSRGDDLGLLFRETGMTLMSQVGGASGMLYGNFFIRAAAAVAGKSELENDELLAALQSGRDGIVQRGRAAIGDKTMVDVWMPALDALATNLHTDGDLEMALRACVAAAEQGMNSTVPLQAKKGRASYLGPRSVGHMDPGAASSVILLRALLDAISQAQ